MISNTKITGGCGGCNGSVAEIIGDGVTTSFPITHGFNSKEIIIAARQATAPFAEVSIPAEFTTNSVVTFTFPVAPAVGEVYIISMERGTNTAAVAGDGVTTVFTITHNLGTRNIIVGARQSFGTFAKVSIPIEFTTVNTITVRFAAAPGSGQVFRFALIPTC